MTIKSGDARMDNEILTIIELSAGKTVFATHE